MSSGDRSWRNQWQIQVMALSGILFLVVFAYVPMFGIVVAFKNVDYSVDIMAPCGRSRG